MIQNLGYEAVAVWVSSLCPMATNRLADTTIACRSISHHSQAVSNPWVKMSVGTLDELGQKEVAGLLDETMTEEKNADKTLTGASKQVNAQAQKKG